MKAPNEKLRFNDLKSYIDDWYLVSNYYPADLRKIYEIYTQCQSLPRGTISSTRSILECGFFDLKMQFSDFKKLELQYIPVFEISNANLIELLQPYLVLNQNKVQAYFSSAMKKHPPDENNWRRDLFADLVLEFTSKHVSIMGYGEKCLNKVTYDSLLRLLELLPIADSLKAIKTAINGANTFCIENKRTLDYQRELQLNYTLNLLLTKFKTGDFFCFQRIPAHILKDRYGIMISSEMELENFWEIRKHLSPDCLSMNILKSLRF